MDQGDERVNGDGITKAARTAEQRLKRGASKLTEEDLPRVTNAVKAKLGELKDLESGLEWIGTLLARVRLIYDMVRDRGFHLEMTTKLLMAAGLVYFVLPMDLTPDFIPGIGYLDDALVLGTLWGMIQEELGRYSEYLRGKKTDGVSGASSSPAAEPGKGAATMEDSAATATD